LYSSIESLAKVLSQQMCLTSMENGSWMLEKHLCQAFNWAVQCLLSS